MFFGVNVWHGIFLVGTPCHLVPFFSNVHAHLEQGRWGSRFPLIMGEFYEGLLSYEHVPQASRELEQIDAELRALPAALCVYDSLEPQKPRPEWVALDPAAENLADTLTSKDGAKIVPMLRKAFSDALYFKEDVWIGDSITDRNKKKRFQEENAACFLFVKENGSLTLDRFFGTRKIVQVPASKDGMPVTVIGRKAFSDSNAEEIILPDTVRELREESFRGCRKLKCITMGDCVENIGEKAFSYCGSLRQAALPAALKVLEAQTFEHCRSMTEITLNDGLEAIGKEALCACDLLSAITIPASVTDISTVAFRNTKKHLAIAAPLGSTGAKYAKKYKIQWQAIQQGDE